MTISDSEWMVAADVGNSALKLCVRRSGQDDNRLIEESFAMDRPSWQADAVEWVDSHVGCANALIWRVASVNRTAADALHDVIADRQSDAMVHRITRHDVPLRVDVDHPDVLGIDRLLGAFAASNRYGCPIVVVDAGSAVTVDFVSGESVFVGGAILPGLALQTRALAAGTDALPEVSWDGQTLRIPGRNTADAMRLGVQLGLAGAVDRIVNDFQQQSTESSQGCQVVVTGGDAATLSGHLQFSHEIVVNLVCRGLLELPRMGRAETT